MLTPDEKQELAGLLRKLVVAVESGLDAARAIASPPARSARPRDQPARAISRLRGYPARPAVGDDRP